jgi:hypothetical protein
MVAEQAIERVERRALELSGGGRHNVRTDQSHQEFSASAAEGERNRAKRNLKLLSEPDKLSDLDHTPAVQEALEMMTSTGGSTSVTVCRLSSSIPNGSRYTGCGWEICGRLQRVSNRSVGVSISILRAYCMRGRNEGKRAKKDFHREKALRGRLG